jgi:hypothetical protein
MADWVFGRISLKSLIFLKDYFFRLWATTQFSSTTKPFFAFGAELRKRCMVIKRATTTADSVGSPAGRPSNANPQLHPYLRLRAGWPLDRWFVG